MTIRGNAFALRGSFLSCIDNPFSVGDGQALHYEADGLIIIENGKITAAGSYAETKHQLQNHPITHYADQLIVPGFIDTHVHYPQTQMIGAYGSQLIEWLNTYTFPAEMQFADGDHANYVAEVFLNELLRVGTTTAAVYCTVHPGSADALFEAARKRRMRIIAGKVLMDRNAPEGLSDTAQSGYDDSLTLIEKWHETDRLLYAVTPRFAPTSTSAQLEATASLLKKHPSCYLQTHLSENTDELSWVAELFPNSSDYLAVYEKYDLVGPKSIFGHAIHLHEREWQALSDANAVIAHCPTSNFFLGSGVFDQKRALQPDPPLQPVRTGLATDVGAGTSFSMLQTMGEAYKAGQLKSYPLSATKAFYLATRGAAEALSVSEQIGTIAAGYEADLSVLNLHSTPLIDFRMQYCDSIEEALFVQMILADDRATHAVYVSGELVYDTEKTTWHTNISKVEA